MQIVNHEKTSSLSAVLKEGNFYSDGKFSFATGVMQRGGYSSYGSCIVVTNLMTRRVMLCPICPTGENVVDGFSTLRSLSRFMRVDRVRLQRTVFRELGIPGSARNENSDLRYLIPVAKQMQYCQMRLVDETGRLTAQNCFAMTTLLDCADKIFGRNMGEDLKTAWECAISSLGNMNLPGKLWY